VTYGLDTSVVLRLLTGEPRDLALQVAGRVMTITRSGGRCAINDLVATESYFALQYHYKMAKEDALAALAALCAGDGIHFSEAACAVLRHKGLARANPGFADRLIHADYRQAGYSMLTCERASASLNGAEVITARA
jgi:predicted nucleic-acid-binding protein